MKINKILLVLLSLISLTSCYKEETIIASEALSLAKYTLDESDVHYDKLKNVLDNYGVLMVYKDFTCFDMSSLIGSLGSSAYNAHYLNAEQAEFSINFMAENVFNPKYLPTNLGNRVFKPYMYLAYDLRAPSPFMPGIETPIESVINGKDFWSVCLQGRDYSIMGYTPVLQFANSSQNITNKRMQYLKFALDRLILKELIKIPTFLKSVLLGGELDYKIADADFLNTYAFRDDPKFFMNRGCPGFIGNGGNKITRASLGNGFSSAEQVFTTYLSLAMLWTPEEVTGEYEAGFVGEKIYSHVFLDTDGNTLVCHKDYPYVVSLYKRVVEYMKVEYNWDITASARAKYTQNVPITPPLTPDESTLGKMILKK